MSTPEPMRWVEEIERMQGGVNGLTIKLRADIERLTEGLEQARAYGSLARKAFDQMTAERDALRTQVATWQGLYRRAVNEANGLTNYVEDRPELRRAERNLDAIQAEARAAMAGDKP